MTDQQKMEKLLKTIRALRAKAEDESVSEAEAATFMAKVQELLAKHGLEEAQLDVKDQEQMGHEEISEDDNEVSWNASSSRKVLIVAICRLYFVHTIRYTGAYKKGTWILIGKPHNIIMAKEMSEYLIKTVLRLGRQYKKANRHSNEVDFKRGCFMRLAERLTEMYRAQAKAAAPVYDTKRNPGNLPALYQNEAELANAYMHQHWPGTRSARRTSVKQGWDAQAGRQAADGISLNRQVGGGRSNHLLTGRK